MDTRTSQYARPKPPKSSEPEAEETQPGEIPSKAKLRFRDIARSLAEGFGSGLEGKRRRRRRRRSSFRRSSSESWMSRILETKNFK